VTKKLVMLGGGGHCSVLLPQLRAQGYMVEAIYATELKREFSDIEHVRDANEMIRRYPPERYMLVNAIGSVNSMTERHKWFEHWKAKDYQFATFISSTALVVPSARIANGVQILSAAMIEPGCVIGENSIINTGTIVNHDCIVGTSVHMSSRVVLSGGVTVGDQTHIGTGAVVIHGITIGRGCLIGAGAVVTENIPDGSTVYPPRAEIR
jgi:sugar O-acyltransferase (sialic acid O-acetyltransferase NeuD family)